jgi:hypothetical protein
MMYRTFGRSGLRVSDFFLGAMTFGVEWGWGTPPEECRQIFEAYAEAGGNVLDTANRYTDGSSERIVGRLLGKDRDRFVLSTKYTMTMDGADPNGGGNHRKNLRRSLDASLSSAVAGESTPREVAAAVGRLIGRPEATVGLPPDQARGVVPFAGWLGTHQRVTAGNAARLGWKPTGVPLIEEIETGSYRSLLP